jgi:parvulin-like peptidyl-prolyl isomerase
MLLRQEEVLDKIGEISEKAMWTRYERDFTPFYKFEAAIVTNEQDVERFRQAVNNGLSFADAAANKDLGWQEAPQIMNIDWVRKGKVPELYQDALVKAKKGESLGPYFWEQKKQYIFVKKNDEKPGDKDDFAKLSQDIKEKLFKEREGGLTLELINKLKTQYEVKVDDELVSTLPLDGAPKDLLDKRVITMKGDRGVTAGQLLEMVKRDFNMRMRPDSEGNRDVKDPIFQDTKKRLVNDFIAQDLTVWAALDRHYENRSPIKEVYDFYRERRMIFELKRRLFGSNIKITDEQARAFYEKNKESFSQPAKVDIVLIQTKDEQLSEFIRNSLLSGKDFFEVAEQVSGSKVTPQQTPVSDLSPPLQEALVSLANGDQVGPVRVDDGFIFIKLIRRQAGMTRPFEEVRKMIDKKLEGEVTKERENAYLAKLRERSTISLDEEQWRTVVSKLQEQANQEKAKVERSKQEQIK